MEKFPIASPTPLPPPFFFKFFLFSGTEIKTGTQTPIWDKEDKKAESHNFMQNTDKKPPDGKWREGIRGEESRKTTSREIQLVLKGSLCTGNEREKKQEKNPEMRIPNQHWKYPSSQGEKNPQGGILVNSRAQENTNHAPTFSEVEFVYFVTPP